MLFPVIIVISMMLLMLMLFLFGSTQDAADFHSRAAGEASQTVQYDIQRDMRKFSLAGKYRNQVDESEVVSRRDGILEVYAASVSRRGRFLSLFSFLAESRSEAVWASLEEAHLVRTADLIFEEVETVIG